MQLHIAPNRIISELQEEFNRQFAFLKLVFFNKKAVSHSDFSANQLVPVTRKIGDIQVEIRDGDLEFDGTMKVNELEKLLKDEFSLAAQVFRKSGNIWLETTITDNWTLNQQNSHGKELSEERIVDNKPEDYDLNRDAGR